MDQFLHGIQELKLFLDSINKTIFYVLCSSLVGGIIYLWRKYHIKSFEAVTLKNPKLQTLPALILGALLAAAPVETKDVWKVIIEVVTGSIGIGGLAIIAHHAAKDIPFLPYQGGRQAEPPESDS